MDLQLQCEEALKKIKLLEQTLEENLQKDNELIKLIESLDDQIFRIRKNDTGDYIITYNEGKVADNYNLRTAQIKGNRIRDMIGEELYASLKPYYDEAFKGEIVKYRGFSFKDRYFSTVLTPFMKDENGNVVEIIGNTQDITEQYYTEEKFKEKTEILKNIIDKNPFGIQILNAGGYHLDCNKAFLDLFIMPPPPQWSLFDDPLIKQSGYQDRLLLLKKREVTSTPPMWYNPHDISPEFPDNPICISTVIFPVFLADGTLENVVLMFENITAKVKAEEDLKKRINELEEFHDLTVGRELKMKEMEAEIEALKKQL